MKTLHVSPESVQIRDGEVHLQAVYSGFDSGSTTVEIAIPQSALRRIPSRSDHFALAALFPTMQSFDRCVIHGEVSRPLLENLSDLNAAWQAWRPEKYRQVQWEADKVVEQPAAAGQRSGHLLAFSGGVDASVTLKRHTSGSLGWRNREIRGALIVHGFDISTSDREGFRKACERAERITSNVGVPLISARTNLRELPNHWEDAFGAKLASVLHVFNETFEGAFVASDEPYAFPKLPWGSNPVSNPWLGTCWFPLRTDGAELKRLEKVRLLSTWEAAIGNIRVCWEGKVPGENCGVCEKCVRTQLELAACGVVPQGTFQVPLHPGMVLAIRPRNEVQLSFLVDILAYSEQNHLAEWWTEELRKVVAKGCGDGGRKRKKWRGLPWRLLRKLIKP